MYRLCRDRALPAWVGTMPELGVGQAQGAALASLDGFVYPTDVEAGARWFQDDIISPPLEVHGGLIDLPGVPGLGYSIDEAKVKKYTVACRRFPE
jgi:O-succinylbenzoate synthase